MEKISEFEYIKRFSAKFLESLPDKIVGIGDDCAVIPYVEGQSLLCTTDTLVDKVHFLSDKMSPYDLAYKSLVVNLSDIAAMGGKPLYILLSLTLPSYFDQKEWLDGFFSGLYDGCSRYRVHLLGGDMSKTNDRAVINITAMGSAASSDIKYRSGAQAGDYLCVTGNIGDSAGGLYCYLNNLGENTTSDISLGKEINKLKEAHLRPRPHIEEGLWLASQKSVKAMIDISDGIESDIQRIMERSHCGAEIELTSLPLSASYRKVARQQQWNHYEKAVAGGEDYCLMLTVEPKNYNHLACRFEKEFNSPLFKIGKILPQQQGLIFTLNKEKINLQQRGYDHFR